MKRIERIWIPSGICLAALILFLGFNAADRELASQEVEVEMILNEDPELRAGDALELGRRKVYAVWEDDGWGLPGVSESMHARVEATPLKSTRKIDLFHDSSEFRRRAKAWAKTYNQVVIDALDTTHSKVDEGE